ncbi:MAG TPA: tetratricopeptide repeat protein [Ktedonobacteraceae bacterium]
MSDCPNCHRPVAPGDDICENCGAVLSIITTTQARYVTAPSIAALPATPGIVTICPTCKTPVKPDDTICENCGMILSAKTSATLSRTSPTQSAPTISVPVSSLTECPRCHQPRKAGSKFCNGCGLRYDSQSSAQLANRQTSGQLATSTITLKIGDLLNNKYKITRELGEGGMGAVFLAEDQLLKRQVVVKALLSENDPDMIAQSIKEREFLAAIKHASIVSIYDFIATGQQGYIVMEYVHGKTLDQIIEDQGHPFEVVDAIKYILGILPAFTYIAKLNLVYCDFKPQNVMLEVLKDGSKVVKLIDLGTVIPFEPHPKDVYGTHGFYAPEAVKTPSPETDLYTICRTLAFLISEMDLANPVFGLPSIESYKAFRDNPALYRLLTKGTHTNAKRRFHSAEQLADQLEGVLRQIEGGRAGQPISSKLFISGMLTTTGKLGLRGEAALDERDKAIDLLKAGDRALRSTNYTSALNFYQQASKANRKSIDAHLRMAEVLIEQGNPDNAKREIEQARTIDPTNWKVTWYTARYFEAKHALRDAADQYNELISELPGELPPQQALARVYNTMGQHQRALGLFKSVLKAEPGNTEAIMGAAESLLKQHKWQDAVAILRDVNEATARYVEAQLLLCDIYLTYASSLQAQHVDIALDALQALGGKTEDPRYYLARGDIYRLLWQLARKGQLPKGKVIPDVRAATPRGLGAVAEASYQRYLRNVPRAINREAIVRKKLEVAPWRLL